MATMRRMLAKAWSSAVTTADRDVSSVDSPESKHVSYEDRVNEIRESEYPTLVGTTYLDHAGTTPYARSTIERWTTELTTNLFGNPHSASAASQLSTRRIDDIRLKVLRFCSASPDDFDVVFVANATAAIKLVAEAFRDNSNGFWYGFHADAHTSLVGCRTLAERGSVCFHDDQGLETWIQSIPGQTIPLDTLQLVAYPGQSNMTGYRTPLRYCQQVRHSAQKSGRRIFTLVDAASLMSTSPLDLGDASAAPDFVALSFYKIFGFPDLGALIVRRQSGDILLQKRYFAGGTVDGVALSEDGWHIRKQALHATLEEGTLPFHNILALDHAMDTHVTLFGSMTEVSMHVKRLASEAKKFLRNVRHANGQRVCDVYGTASDEMYGPIISFNLKDDSGKIISASEVEKLCIVKGLQLRTGGLCNPGGIARYLQLSTEQIKSNYETGRRCDGRSELINGKPTGVMRISFGAMSTRQDLHKFVSFIREYYIQHHILKPPEVTYITAPQNSPYLIEGLFVYPIKSCGAFAIPSDRRWQVTEKGLAWDREWCLVHEGTKAALSQKRYPKMTLLQPSIDLLRRTLTVSYTDDQGTEFIELNLDEMPEILATARTCGKDVFRTQNSTICGDTIPVHIYSSNTVTSFFSRALGVPCCLARYPKDTGYRRDVKMRKPTGEDLNTVARKPQLMLSNESPILIVSASSVDELNRQIEQNTAPGHKLVRVPASSFRANIVVAQTSTNAQGKTPYAEDSWTSLSVTTRHKSLNLTSSDMTNKTCYLDSEDAQSDTSNPLIESILGSFSTSPSTTNTMHTDGSNPSNTSLKPSDLPSVTSSSPRREPTPSIMHLDILGPCQRCQMLSINQVTAASQQEPYSTLSKTRRKGDGRVWFGMHASLAMASNNPSERVAIKDGASTNNIAIMKAESGEGMCYVQVGDLVLPSSR